MFSRFLFFDRDRNRWLDFSRTKKTFRAWSVSEVAKGLEWADHMLGAGYTVAGFISYEAAPAMDESYKTYPAQEGLPLVFFVACRDVKFLQSLPRENERAFSFEPWQPDISRDNYLNVIGRIKDYIEQGDTYQVNYTFRLKSRLSGDSFAMFRKVLSAQPGAYAAYLETDNYVLASFTPELFFSLENEELLMRPMKGTMHRGLTASDDRQLARALELSEKDQAENLMIVDMVRNDLGRVARPGSVQVPRLLRVEKYPTVWQMTSDVSAQSDAPFSTIISSLFPCASITGAPKARTMEIINELETTPRGIYTGSIGYVTPQRRACFSVAIRTVVVNRQTSEAVYGVGSGIVWDSAGENEYEECRVKSRVLTREAPDDFALLETMLWEKDNGIYLRDYHLQRLAESAAYFDFIYPQTKIDEALSAISGETGQRLKLRLLLYKSGRFELQQDALSAGSDENAVTCIVLPQAVNSNDPFLYHKTTNRPVYDKALQAAKKAAADDAILLNEKGEITESCIANVVLELDGKLLTPPISCGLLSGTYRRYLFDCGRLEEQILTVDDLKRAEKVWLINSVRRWQKVRVLSVI